MDYEGFVGLMSYLIENNVEDAEQILLDLHFDDQRLTDDFIMQTFGQMVYADNALTAMHVRTNRPSITLQLQLHEQNMLRAVWRKCQDVKFALSMSDEIQTIDLDNAVLRDVLPSFGKHNHTVLLDATFEEVVTFFQEVCDLQLAVCMCGHTRLGNQSELRVLCNDIIRMIVHFNV